MDFWQILWILRQLPTQPLWMHVKGSSIILQDHITDAVQKLACVAGAILGGRARVGEARGEGKGERKGARKNGRGEKEWEGRGDEKWVGRGEEKWGGGRNGN